MAEKKDKEPGAAKERLLEAGLDIFGKHGYEAATTRMIAAQAGVNISAIPYYFGGKEGLYHAVVASIVTGMQQVSGELRTTMESESFTGEAGRELALHTIEKFIITMISFLVGSPYGQRVSRIILREQMYPSSAYDIVFSGFMEPVLAAISRLIMVMGKAASIEQAKLMAMTIFGQVLVFRVARETVVRALDYRGYTEDELEKIRNIIITHTRAVLGSQNQTDHHLPQGRPGYEPPQNA